MFHVKHFSVCFSSKAKAVGAARPHTRARG